jgi:hypothetical protein
MLYDSVWGAILRRRLNETQAKFVCTKSYYDDRHPKKVTERLPTLEKVELWNSRELKRGRRNQGSITQSDERAIGRAPCATLGIAVGVCVGVRMGLR